MSKKDVPTATTAAFLVATFFCNPWRPASGKAMRMSL